MVVCIVEWGGIAVEETVMGERMLVKPRWRAWLSYKERNIYTTSNR
jgi:hypothetical protein